MRWISALCNLISATMQPYVTVFLLGTLTLGMKKMVLFPFGMRIPTPWAIMNVSLANSVTHVFTYSPRRNCFYSYNIPVMGSITSLASKWIHASCYVRICVAREYLGVVQPILGCCCSFWYFRVSTTVGFLQCYYCQPWWRSSDGASWWHPWLWSSDGSRQWHPRCWFSNRSYSGKICCKYFMQGFDGLQLLALNW